jgi:hypothetical protein
VDAIGEQGLGLTDDAKNQFEACEQQVEGGADQCHSPLDPVLILKRRLHAARSLNHNRIS